MIAAICGFFFARFALQSLKDKASLQQLWLMFIGAYIPGWLGARALGICLEEPQNIAPTLFLTSLFSPGPMVFYGGAIAGCLGVLVVVWTKKLNLPRIFDVAIPSVVLGLGIGRIGCFLNGCDYGIPAKEPAWWNHTNAVLADGIARYPTQLEESLFSFLLASLAYFLYWKCSRILAKKPGVLGAFTLMATALNRFFNEYYRGDERGHFLELALSTSQGVALALTFVGALVFVVQIFSGTRNDDVLV